MSLIFLLIGGYLLYLLVRLLWNAWKSVSAFRRFMDDPVGEAMRQAQEQARRQKQAHGFNGFGASAGAEGFGDSRRSRRKKIDSDVGEYVEFTEVELSAEQRRASDGHVSFTTEQQITDIEWEDIR